jgi:hypothetical protein
MHRTQARPVPVRGAAVRGRGDTPDTSPDLAPISDASAQRSGVAVDILSKSSVCSYARHTPMHDRIAHGTWRSLVRE